MTSYNFESSYQHQLGNKKKRIHHQAQNNHREESRSLEHSAYKD
jgi:hypothetical protein